ncbi:MAG: winged helix-turn-helix domain-containing protein [Bryobacterales bacterium]|nr:winged helix-turn-helix domain-containing protein [Bryobacterales bacterium]MCZ2146497.1 winged helix-turn-helix domain-containing protein [Bryobacterales bacterium]MCZ2146577.1 winged helix-turn-helix domain-containing protein [Bryobacterales bacterium]MCZ2150683.1 winged helix-turn-helix domain-containing protein [Bryobacterales bacterium]MCZ2152200.1 winged helix-turn-helix domain-containing protein [Bryobacterales bacterium]
MALPQPRDFSWLEKRRKQASRLFAKGQTVLASVARQLNVSRQSVSRWYQLWKKGGAGALKGAGRAGRKPRLSSRQLQQLETALLRGAAAHGFSAEHWTLTRVAVVIERITGQKYHPGHVWKILGSIQWSPQKPERQAKERSQEKVNYWKNVRWPEVKKTLLANKPGSSSTMKPDSRSSRRSAPVGRRAAKHRS